jgi:7-cyano-7-deazaguanine reductase
MPVPEGRVFKFDDESVINSSFLETIDYTGARQKITCSTDEFSAVCPFSGLPDVGTVTLTYIPRVKIIELKSLKYYYVSFRNSGIYQEAVTDRIFRDLRDLLQPEYLSVKTEYNLRGGILTICEMDTDTAG